MIYREQIKIPHIHFIHDDYRNSMNDVREIENVVVVTDPPFNIGYHYDSYSDNMPEADYMEMLSQIANTFPSVFIHYPEQLHKLSIKLGVAPEKIVSWVYNSNTAKQHRDIAWYGIKPNFKNAWQPYKNPNDKRIKQRIADGSMGGRMYDWWNVNQVKNVSKCKTGHPCQMPLEVMKNIISTLPEDVVVFDPFMGSGTTALACIELGYDFIGCEIDKKYYEMAKDRIKAAIDALGERPMVWTDDDQYTLGERNQYDRDRLAIETLPSAEKKGKWISDEDGNIYCSVCGKTGVGESFCEHCRANMKGEEE